MHIITTIEGGQSKFFVCSLIFPQPSIKYLLRVKSLTSVNRKKAKTVAFEPFEGSSVSNICMCIYSMTSGGTLKGRPIFVCILNCKR